MVIQQQVKRCTMVPIIGIDVCVQRASVYDETDDPTSPARISSIRSEMSTCPLLPAPAAASLRRLPRWAAIASLVSSETVIPRLLASCLSRASRSSGSLTVVRIMVCQHTRRVSSEQTARQALRSNPGRAR